MSPNTDRLHWEGFYAKVSRAGKILVENTEIAMEIRAKRKRYREKMEMEE